MHKCSFKIVLPLIFALALTTQNVFPALADDVPLKGPITPGTAPVVSDPVTPVVTEPVTPPLRDSGSGLGLAPGEDGTMTQDLILVSPENSKTLVGKALAELAGSELKLQVDRSDVVFEKLRGVVITVTNNTNRPIVVDGDLAKAKINGQDFACVPVSAIQLAIVPHHNITQEFEDILVHVVPAAFTVGAAPTLRDYRNSKKPVLERYGPDELRRKIEFSRFGRRILWTQQKVQGIVYFDGSQPLSGARIEIPAATFFDNKDAATLTSGP
jgi:hypothetical protein